MTGLKNPRSVILTGSKGKKVYDSIMNNKNGPKPVQFDSKAFEAAWDSYYSGVAKKR